MDIFISADIEGLAGIVNARQTSPTGPCYEDGRLWMLEQVNAAIDGAFAGGATRVVVKDAHGPGTNLRYHLLDPRAELISDWGPLSSMIEGISGEFDALFLVGYHARAGSELGTLAHSFNSRIRNITVNGVAMGEIGLNAALAGSFGVRTALIVSDSLGVDEARALVPGIEGVAVKEALSMTCARSLPRESVAAAIRQGAARALEDLPRLTPLRHQYPAEMIVEWNDYQSAHLCSYVPGVEKLDASRIRFRSPDALALERIWRVCRMLNCAASLTNTGY